MGNQSDFIMHQHISLPSFGAFRLCCGDNGRKPELFLFLLTNPTNRPLDTHRWWAWFGSLGQEGGVLKVTEAEVTVNHVLYAITGSCIPNANDHADQMETQHLRTSLTTPSIHSPREFTVSQLFVISHPSPQSDSHHDILLFIPTPPIPPPVFLFHLLPTPEHSPSNSTTYPAQC